MKISDLKNMRVVNLGNGKVMGKIVDLVLDVNRGYVKAVVLPGESKLLGIWNSDKVTEVPWNRIKKIGKDVIIIDLPESYSLASDR